LFKALFIRLLRNAVALGFYLVSNLDQKVKVEEVVDFSFSAPALVIANHQSDMDVPLIASLFFFRSSLKAFCDKIRFVAEEDLFLPGFFPQHFSLPFFLAPFLFNFSMGKILRVVGAFPVFKMTDLSLGRMLRVLKKKEGEDLKLGHALSEEGIKLFSRLLNIKNEEIPFLPLRDALNWKYYRHLKRPAGSELLNEKYARLLRENRLQGATAQMEFFSRILQDKVLLMFPEGEITQDGRLGKIRGGTYRILEKAQWRPTVLPLTVNYDFLGKKRRALVVIGKGIRASQLKTERKEFNSKIEDMLKEGMRLMFSHLGSAALYFLKERKMALFTGQDFLWAVERFLYFFRQMGVKMDPALSSVRYLRSRTKGFLRFLKRKGYIVKLRDCFLLFSSFLEDKPDRARNPVGYYFQKLQDFPYFSRFREYLEKESSALTPA